ncbi:MAG: XdhC family protein [Gemmatimonadota bacterium]|nr:MAG: XdhC family protein [Gemmatimonadota bacterium]
MVRTEDDALYRALAKKAKAGRPCALATVVATRGSTPRKVGAKMLVDPEEGLVGTIGGGCGEGEVLEAVEEVLRTGVPRMVLIDLTKDFLTWDPAVCGGTMEVFVESIRTKTAAK